MQRYLSHTDGAVGVRQSTVGNTALQRERQHGGVTKVYAACFVGPGVFKPHSEVIGAVCPKTMFSMLPK